MTNVTKVSTITNTTGALIPAGNASVMVNSGQEYAWQVINRTIIAAEIGTGVGQLSDNINPPVAGVNGFLFAQFKGVYIKNASFKLIRPQNVGASGTLSGFSEIMSGTAQTVRLQWYTYYNQGVSNLYLFDSGSAAPANVVAGDIIMTTVALGNS